MNLSALIPKEDSKEIAKNFLRSIHNARVTVSGNGRNIDCLYCLGEEQYFFISVYNEYQLEQSDPNLSKDYLHTIFEDINEIELVFYKTNANSENYRTFLMKDSYPVDLLGSDSKDYLASKDTSPLNKHFYTLDSLEYVIEYLSVLYDYNKNLLSWLPLEDSSLVRRDS